MDKVDFKVRTSPEQAGQKLLNWIEKASISGSLIDQHVSRNDDFTLIVLIFEKYFMRNSSRASLTVTLDNLEGPTRVQATGSGGGQEPCSDLIGAQGRSSPTRYKKPWHKI